MKLGEIIHLKKTNITFGPFNKTSSKKQYYKNRKHQYHDTTITYIRTKQTFPDRDDNNYIAC